MAGNVMEGSTVHLELVEQKRQLDAEIQEAKKRYNEKVAKINEQIALMETAAANIRKSAGLKRFKDALKHLRGEYLKNVESTLMKLETSLVNMADEDYDVDAIDSAITNFEKYLNTESEQHKKFLSSVQNIATGIEPRERKFTGKKYERAKRIASTIASEAAYVARVGTDYAVNAVVIAAQSIPKLCQYVDGFLEGFYGIGLDSESLASEASYASVDLSIKSHKSVVSAASYKIKTDIDNQLLKVSVGAVAIMSASPSVASSSSSMSSSISAVSASPSTMSSSSISTLESKQTNRKRPKSASSRGSTKKQKTSKSPKSQGGTKRTYSRR